MGTVSAWLLAGCGVVLMFIGGYFVALRPALLPEDARFIGSTPDHIRDLLPGLTTWLRRVFWVLGGYIATTGLLVVYVATTGVRTGDGAALAVVAVAGATSIGWMSIVNFTIHSDFRWALLGLDAMWGAGLLLAVVAR